MRIALISDIHGNLVALEAVLADIERADVDQIICLGDVATLGPQPRETLQRIKDLNCLCILGNHDHYLLDPSILRDYMDAPWFANSVAWCAKQLKEEDFQFLHTFQPLIELPLQAPHKLLCFHGSPKSNTDIILAMTPPTNVDELLAGYRTTVMAGGHTHMQMMRQHKGIMLVNPGSVGMPFEQALFVHAPRYLPWAEYAIISQNGSTLNMDLRRVPVDLAAVHQAAEKSNLPDAQEWIKNWMNPEDLF
jgi:putative phosphoesterase